MSNYFNSDEFARSINRRTFLQRSAYGVGGLALGTLLGDGAANAAPPAVGGGIPGVITKPHFPIRAKRIIHLCMAGGPSQHESFDFKPRLKELHGQPFPESMTKGQQLAQLQGAKLIARGYEPLRSRRRLMIVAR